MLHKNDPKKSGGRGACAHSAGDPCPATTRNDYIQAHPKQTASASAGNNNSNSNKQQQQQQQQAISIKNTHKMSEPDELYTLRAQYWLGHFPQAINEAKNLQRRPMSIPLKAEREEFLARSYLELKQYHKITPTADSSPGTCPL